MSKLIKAGSLIICAATKDNQFKILLLNRGTKGFYGNLTVFPGGATESHDLNPDFGCLMKKNKWEDKYFLAITAIRETFEETGLLLLHPYISLEHDEKVALRQKILDDPAELIRYCKKTSRIPPKLAYWSNWISPLNHPKRFDTHFFLHLLSDEQYKKDLIVPDGSETVSASWMTAREVLDLFKKRKIHLLPPQYVSLIELERLTLDKLKNIIDRDDRKVKPLLPSLLSASPEKVVIKFDIDPTLDFVKKSSTMSLFFENKIVCALEWNREIDSKL